MKSKELIQLEVEQQMMQQFIDELGESERAQYESALAEVGVVLAKYDPLISYLASCMVAGNYARGIAENVQ